MSEVIVTHAHLRSLGYCNRGARAFFERHGLDWHRFRREGLPCSVFESTGDAMAIKLTEWAKCNE